MPKAQKLTHQEASFKKSASFAVARNCGTGSSSLNAEVKAFERLTLEALLPPPPEIGNT